MSLLTDADIGYASEDELVETVRAIHQRLDALDEAAVLSVAKETLVKHGVTELARITFGVDEWEDGFFYDSIQVVDDGRGQGVLLSEEVLDGSRRSAGRAVGALGVRDASWTIRPAHHRPNP